MRERLRRLEEPVKELEEQETTRVRLADGSVHRVPSGRPGTSSVASCGQEGRAWPSTRKLTPIADGFRYCGRWWRWNPAGAKSRPSSRIASGMKGLGSGYPRWCSAYGP
jgi:hypothetical protein